MEKDPKTYNVRAVERAMQILSSLIGGYIAFFPGWHHGEVYPGVEELNAKHIVLTAERKTGARVAVCHTGALL